MQPKWMAICMLCFAHKINQSGGLKSCLCLSSICWGLEAVLVDMTADIEAWGCKGCMQMHLISQKASTQSCTGLPFAAAC